MKRRLNEYQLLSLCFELCNMTLYALALVIVLASWTRPLPPQPLHHQHVEGGSGHSGTVYVTDVEMCMTNEIQARVMIGKFECTWSKDQSVVNITCTCLE